MTLSLRILCLQKITGFVIIEEVGLCPLTVFFCDVKIAQVISKPDGHKARGRFEITSRITP